MRQSALVLFLELVLLGLTACGSGGGMDRSQPEQTTQTAEDTGNMSPEETAPRPQTEYIGPAPEEYFAPSDHPGQVAEITYDSRDYTDTAEPAIQKTAYVYLPYGYDETDADTRYNILYLMHGWTMTAGDFFDTTQSGIVPMLDHLIENGDIPPVIVVCATFDAQNQPQGFSRSVEELSVFHRDLRENLIPFVESRYHTYAQDVTGEGLRASREHRAFGGFSLGAVTTWYQFIYNLDYIKYFVPMSGDCWIMGTYGGRNYPVETVDYLEQVRDMEQALTVPPLRRGLAWSGLTASSRKNTAGSPRKLLSPKNGGVNHAEKKNPRPASRYHHACIGFNRMWKQLCFQ